MEITDQEKRVLLQLLRLGMKGSGFLSASKDDYRYLMSVYTKLKLEHDLGIEVQK